MGSESRDERATLLRERVAKALAKRASGSRLAAEDWDALTVAAYRYLDEHIQETDPRELPELPEEHRKALDSLGDGFIERLLANRQVRQDLKGRGQD
jgi:hypothetical protein